MNHTQLDFLLQATVARPEPVASNARSRDAGPPFDNLFRQASESGTSSATQNLYSTPLRPADSSPDEAQRRSSTADQQRSTPSTRASSQPTPQSESPISDSDEANADDESTEAADAELEDDAEVAAVLAAEQATKAAANDAAALAALPQGAAGNSEHDESESDSKGTRADTKQEIASAAQAQANARNADSQTGEPPTPETTQPTETLAVESSDKSLADTKPEKLSDGNHVSGPAIEAATATSAAQTSPTAAEQASSTAIERQAAPRRSDKKSSARTDATNRDAGTTSAERLAAPTSAPSASPSTPIAANVQQKLPTEAATAASTSAAPAAKSSAATADTKQGILSSIARLDRGNTHNARAAGRAGHSESTPHVDPARFVSRVARAVQTAQERGGPLQLRLSPPELGAMRLELSMNGGALTATIETDNSTAKQLLLDNLPALRDRLADQNVKIERFDVDVRRDPTGGQQNAASQDREQQQPHNSAAANSVAARRQTTVPTFDEPQPINRTISNTSINVVA